MTRISAAAAMPWVWSLGVALTWAEGDPSGTFIGRRPPHSGNSLDKQVDYA